MLRFKLNLSIEKTEGYNKILIRNTDIKVDSNRNINKAKTKI